LRTSGRDATVFADGSEQSGISPIRRDRPEVIEAGTPLRPVLAVGQLAPRFPEHVMGRIGATELFRRVAAWRGRAA
jgi:hypothetical protein